MKKSTVATFAALAMSSAIAAPAMAEGEVNVYSYRQPFLIEPLLKAFTEKTGVKTNVIFAKKGLEARIEAEGENSPADILMTVDIGRLHGAKMAGIAQPLKSDILEKNIPSQYRDKDGEWFGLTTRARVIYASNDRVEQNSITYEELADPKWKGKICTRSGQHVYSIALFASMVAHKGEEEAKKWLEGVKANLARKPTGNDRAQVKAIYSGECDLSLGNTYYMGKMQTNTKEPEQQDWAKSVRILFPNTNDRGTHVNISGMLLAKYAPNKDNAVKLMEFLSSGEAQKIYAEANHEYPVLDGVEASKLVQSWGSFKADSLSLNKVADARKKASELVDIVDFDAGAN
ncbi:iron(III) transport system substrate-binding protein [Cohaesibacter gelatinilyticus]|uniref:Iron(III) transport system substrate-binding protein n=2 Tax=Cohaesibacter gelatinilyticus TaxID=372072 RepID=A0A285N9J5_9HYPH|nr:Fe(3+) ABC transporter substrate-binding protein [Cohaesibacter gelatinilyticus]SNZ06109.1 iron(III) transport system substrate-binding protein [Cohaesibacter gelatinilyticus]